LNVLRKEPSRVLGHEPDEEHLGDGGKSLEDGGDSLKEEKTKSATRFSSPLLHSPPRPIVSNLKVPNVVHAATTVGESRKRGDQNNEDASSIIESATHSIPSTRASCRET